MGRSPDLRTFFSPLPSHPDWLGTVTKGFFSTLSAHSGGAVADSHSLPYLPLQVNDRSGHPSTSFPEPWPVARTGMFQGYNENIKDSTFVKNFFKRLLKNIFYHVPAKAGREFLWFFQWSL